MEYDDLCKKVMNLDKDIRFVGILGKNGTLLAGGFMEGVEPFLTPTEAKMSLHYASQRWEGRKNLSHRIGNAKYSMTVYEKIKQFSFPITNNDILLISSGKDVEDEKIIKNVMDLINTNFKTN
jgi:hypothetical protein